VGETWRVWGQSQPGADQFRHDREEWGRKVEALEERRHPSQRSKGNRIRRKRTATGRGRDCRSVVARMQTSKAQRRIEIGVHLISRKGHLGSLSLYSFAVVFDVFYYLFVVPLTENTKTKTTPTILTILPCTRYGEVRW